MRLLLATCDTDFPTGTYDDLAHATAFAALITSAAVSATFELTDFAWGDPTTTKKQYKSRRSPATTITTGRQLTAKDFNAVDENAAGTPTPFHDRLFYVNTVQNKSVKIRGYVTDAGKVYLFLNSAGEFMSYDINFWTGWDQDVDGQSVEFKNYMIDFTADPLATMTTPYLDIPAADPTNTLDIFWLYIAN